MPCRIELDWIACVIEIVGTIFFIIGLSTDHWAASDDGSAHSGLFTSCKSNGLCYDTHVFYAGYAEKGQIICAAVFTLLVMAGFCIVLLLMLFYMCGLFEEKSVGLLAATVSYIAVFVGFIGIIVYGSAVTKVSQTVSWSCGMAIMGLIINLAGGVIMHVGSQRYKPNIFLLPPIPPRRGHPFMISQHRMSRRLLNKRAILPR
ncbi:uncharacterized protein LOC110458099 [Mizuhopecten yessoensis]|uniref:Uncharacterized protein n=1 Tax=Mizuhopecten yessoensis TaxID=6573 RepID=A0A210Q7B3_MIZYE|nr:uncharacterized protein LOC110458099 [Mizuhopecten yessoensis]OWF44611.1 hypothetical protein KP79_PYT23857 [Mizuhopecten yessoensis]